MRNIPRLCRRGALACLAVAAALELLWIFAPPSRSWVEATYSRHVYPAIAGVLVPVTGAVPFSLSIAALAFAVALSIAWPISSWRRWRKEGASVRCILLRWLGRLAAIVVVVYALFIALWGAGYRRERLEERLGLTGEPASEEDLSRWVSGIVEIIERDLVPPDERDAERALASLRSSLEEVVTGWDGMPAALPRYVKLAPPGAFLAFGSAGMTVPFLLEPHVDAGEPDVSFLAIATHELAHVAGFCAEADADFAAAVAGLRADDALARYSIALWLFEKLVAELSRPEEVASARAGLPAAARADLDEMRRARARYRVASLARMQSRVYDTYLRSQGLTHGLKEYSFVARMLVAAEKKGIVSPGGAGDVREVPGGAAR